jgi:iron-sulfur cluster repair protein YtfE (RIC family)
MDQPTKWVERDTTLAEVAARVPGGLTAIARTGLHRAPLDGTTVEAACARLGLCLEDSLDVMAKIAEDARRRGEASLGELDASDLALRITRTHHIATFETAHVALALARRLAHGTEPVLGTIAELVETLVLELHAHIDREDRGVLSRARTLVRHGVPKHVREGDLERAIHAMRLDHQAIALLFAELRARAGGYRARSHASNLWRGLYELLEELDADVRFARWVEETSFFPQVVELQEDAARTRTRGLTGSQRQSVRRRRGSLRFTRLAPGGGSGSTPSASARSATRSCSAALVTSALRISPRSAVPFAR